MKKTLIAAAALMTMAAGAMAAEVTLYGRLDPNLTYLHVKSGDNKANYFGVQSNQYTTSRWGIKGTEDFGNGWKVGFVLESSFSADTGVGNNAFNREAAVKVYSPAGTFTVGKTGTFKQTTSSVGWVGSYGPYGGGVGDILHATTRTSFAAPVANNNVVFESAWINGFQFGVSYAFGDDTQSLANKTDRYMSAGARYQNGGFKAGLIADYIRRGRLTQEYKNPFSLTLGSAYNFGPATGSFQVAYQKNGALPTMGAHFGGTDGSEATHGYKGFGVCVGVDVPVGAANLKANYLYANHKSELGDLKYVAHNIAGGAVYHFSKTLEANAEIGYTQRKEKFASVSTKVFGVTAGLTKYF